MGRGRPCPTPSLGPGSGLGTRGCPVLWACACSLGSLEKLACVQVKTSSLSCLSPGPGLLVGVACVGTQGWGLGLRQRLGERVVPSRKHVRALIRPLCVGFCARTWSVLTRGLQRNESQVLRSRVDKTCTRPQSPSAHPADRLLGVGAGRAVLGLRSEGRQQRVMRRWGQISWALLTAAASGSPWVSARPLPAGPEPPAGFVKPPLRGKRPAPRSPHIAAKGPR